MAGRKEHNKQVLTKDKYEILIIYKAKRLV